MFSKDYLKATAERAVKTFGQSLLALFLADEAFNVLSVNWGDSLAVAASATVLSVLTSVVSSPFGPTGSPSLVAVEPAASDEEDYTPDVR